MRRLSCLFVASALLMGCVGGSKELTEKDRQRLAQYVSTQPPKDTVHKLDTNFDDKIRLVGYDVEPKGAVKPGTQVKLTMYWRVDKKLDNGWSLFTHVLDGAGDRVLNIDNVGPLREWRETKQAMGPSDWEAGKYYRDEQTFTLPTTLKSNRVQVVTGIWKGDDRLKITMGPHDRVNRANVVVIPTIGGTADAARQRSTRTPMLRVDKLEKDPKNKITIDGKLDEEAWRRAPTAGPFIDVSTGEPNRAFPVNASVKVLWDDDGMYLGFDVKDPDIIGGFEAKAKDPHLWTKDTVEVMIDPDGDGDNKDYFEIQIGPQNLVFDSHFDDYNKPKTEPDGPFGHQDWSAELKSAVVIDGTLDKSGDQDKGYVVEAMIPWKSFAKWTKAPPQLGSTWRMNFYAMKNNGGVAWSAILGQGNFHKASRFGRVMWTERGYLPPEVQARMQEMQRRGAVPGPSGMPHLLSPISSGAPVPLRQPPDLNQPKH